MNKKLVVVWLIGLFLVSGCATANMNKLNNLRRDKSEQCNLTETLNYSRRAVFNASIQAISNKTKAIVRYSDLSKGEIYAQTSFATAFATGFTSLSGATGSNIGIFIEEDNPTRVRIAQLNYGSAHENYKNLIMQEIKSILEKVKE